MDKYVSNVLSKFDLSTYFPLILCCFDKQDEAIVTLFDIVLPAKKAAAKLCEWRSNNRFARCDGNLRNCSTLLNLVFWDR